MNLQRSAILVCATTAATISLVAPSSTKAVPRLISLSHSMRVAPQGQGSTPKSARIRILLHFPAMENSKPTREADIPLSARVLLKVRLKESGYEAVVFSPMEEGIQKALAEHRLDAADIVEPVSPEALKRIAVALDATQILVATTKREPESMSTDAQVLERVGTEWTTHSSDRIDVPLMLEQPLENGKAARRKLRAVESATILADALAVRLGLPSALTPDLLGTAPRQTRPNPKINVPKNGKQDPKKPDPQKPDDGDKPDEGQDTPPPPVKPTVPAKNGKPKTDPVRVKPDPKSQDSGPEKQVPVAVPPVAPPQPKRIETPVRTNDRTFTAFSTDGAAGRVDDPKTPAVGPPVSAQKFDAEAVVARYRQNGDLANVIVSLKKAINERPREGSLRRELILAYKEKGMLDAALSEANRAIIMLPNEQGLHKTLGDILTAKGDLEGARKAYNDAISHDGTDSGSQVALSDALLQSGKFDEAAVGYEKAAKADPKNPLPLRRLARAAIGRAQDDPTQYTSALDYLSKAKALTPSSETEGYLDDYAALMRLIESRLKLSLGEVQGDLQAQRSGKLTTNELKKSLANLKDQSTALSEFLDKAQAASGQDSTHAHYQMTANLLLQAVTLYRDYLNTNDPTGESAIRGAIVDGFKELADASKRLNAIRPLSAASN